MSAPAAAPLSAGSLKRISSVDVLKGLVMIVMALDHVRDYFHYPAFFHDPADPLTTSLPLFFTRWITHFCAPAFSFLAGVSACMAGRRKTPKELSVFLLKRGLWLVFIELTILNIGWFSDLHYRLIFLGVIWSLGVSMIVLAALIHLPRTAMLAICCLLIFGHNFFDHSPLDGNVFWDFLHYQNGHPVSENRILLIGYPLVPWVAVMSLGYYFGAFYQPGYSAASRKKWFNIIGISALVLFVVLRLTAFYGDPKPWHAYPAFSQSLVAFLNPAKYPPSLLYLLMTLGGVLLFLANAENFRGKLADFFSTFGRVPFFYYIIHVYIIHAAAFVAAALTGFGWQKLVLTTWITRSPAMQGYGFNLLTVYIFWFILIAILYPLCKRFDRYKLQHKEQWWVSYL